MPYISQNIIILKPKMFKYILIIYSCAVAIFTFVFYTVGKKRYFEERAQYVKYRHHGVLTNNNKFENSLQLKFSYLHEQLPSKLIKFLNIRYLATNYFQNSDG